MARGWREKQKRKIRSPQELKKTTLKALQKEIAVIPEPNKKPPPKKKFGGFKHFPQQSFKRFFYRKNLSILAPRGKLGFFLNQRVVCKSRKYSKFSPQIGRNCLETLK